jgi:hypothetical protein
MNNATANLLRLRATPKSAEDEAKTTLTVGHARQGCVLGLVLEYALQS